MFVVKQVPVCNSILLMFACVVLKKVHVRFLGFPECLIFLDSDKQLNQQCSLLNFTNFYTSFVRKI